MNLASGVITTVVGNGNSGFNGDGGPATAAELRSPSGVAVDAAGDLFILDQSYFVYELGRNEPLVREVNLATGIISTVAGDVPATVNLRWEATMATADRPPPPN